MVGLDGPAQRRIGLIVQGRRGVVQNEDFRVAGQGPGDQHPLLLPAGEVGALDLRLVAESVVQGADVLHRRRVLHRRQQRPILQRAAKADVLPQGVIEHHVVLKHHAELPPQCVQLVGAHVAAIHKDAALLHVVKPHQKVDDSGLAAAGGADDPQALAPLQGKADVAEAIFPLLTVPGVGIVAEGHMLKTDELLSLGRLGLLRQQDKLIRLQGKHLLDAVGGGRGLAEHDENPVDAHDALDDHVEVRQKGQNHAGLDGPGVDPPGAHPDHQGEAQVQAHLHQGAGNGHDGAGPDIGPGHSVVLPGKVLLLIGRLAQGLDDADAGDVLPHHPHHLVQPRLHLAVEGDTVAGNAENHHHQHRHDHQQNRGQGRVHGQGDGDAAQEHHGHPHAHGLQRLDAGLDIIAVAGHAADEAGQAEVIKLRAGEVGRLGKEGLAHVVGDAVGIVNGDAVGPDVQLPSEYGCQNHQRAPQKHQLQPPQGHHLVDEMLQDIGNQQLRHGARQLNGHGDRDFSPVKAHLAQNQFHGFRPSLPKSYSHCSIFPARRGNFLRRKKTKPAEDG